MLSVSLKQVSEGIKTIKQQQKQNAKRGVCIASKDVCYGTRVHG